MGIFSKPSKYKYIQPESFPGAPKLRKTLATTAEPGALERLRRAGETYPGQLTAPLSEFETTGLEQLGQYLESPLPTTGGLYGAARGEVEKTLAGEEYDPFKGEYYQAFQENLKRELAEAKDRLAARTSARDAFYGGGRVAGEAELEETALGGLRQELGRLQEAERARMLGVVPWATEMTAYEEQAPLTRIAAAQEFGALPREWQQAGLDREKLEYLRQLTDLGLPLEVAFKLATWQPRVIQEFQPKEQKAWVEDVSGIMGMATGLSKLFPSGGGAGKGLFSPSVMPSASQWKGYQQALSSAVAP